MSQSQSSPSPSTFDQVVGGSPLATQYQYGRKSNALRKDVVIIGGGLAGLSTALYLTQIDPDRHICIVERRPPSSTTSSVSDPSNRPSNVASMAAAGMLAPHSERLPKGDYLSLCLESKRMYVDFVSMVETLAKEAGPEGEQYLWLDDENDGTASKSNALEAWNIGYSASGGFLAPAFAGDSVATWAPPQGDDDDEKGSTTAIWLDAMQVRELEPHLHPDVVGGWWFPEDASVDARRLTCSLKAACVGAGVEFLCGDHYEVTSLDLQEGTARGLWLKSGKYVSVKSLLVANGAWMRNLLPVPLEPHKGQSLSLRMPQDRPPLLRRVLFAQDSYIVPKADGRIVIGATVEAGSFDPNVTPAGIMHILSHALQLVPGLADLPLEETWAGLRPTTPDKGPILGGTPWKNLFLAGGYWRNGVLLAPKTGQLLAALIASSSEKYINNRDDLLTPMDREFLRAFSWDRFTSPEGSKRLAANSRYAASMYPVHTRRSGVGVAAAVGTELGSYSTARSAGEERKRDRDSLFGRSSPSTRQSSDTNPTSKGRVDEEDADAEFEKAALLGIEDASVFEGYGNMNNPRRGPSTDLSSLNSDETVVDEISLRPTIQLPSLESSKFKSSTTVPYGGSADAFTVGFVSEDSLMTSASPSTIEILSGLHKKDRKGQTMTNPNETPIDTQDDLKSIYQFIRDNKSKQAVELPLPIAEDKPDPGFRIYHVDKEGTSREVPPYTSPGAFLSNLKNDPNKKDEPRVAIDPPPAFDADLTSSSNESASSNGKRTGNSYDETTFDGYQTILEANSSTDRADELKAMREARQKNREGYAES
jgi:glycine/D-amino acid oxidase-like deaminating enzyme